MRESHRRFCDRLLMLVLAGPHLFGCAGYTRDYWEITRRADELVPARQIREACGGAEPCFDFCERLIDNQLEEPFRNLCETDRGDSFGIERCEARGANVVLTCEVEDTHKGCMPDS